MTDAELWAVWRLWVAGAAVLVLAAAGLLITIWITARRILAEAVRALAAAQAIETRTDTVWALQSTNEVAGRLLETVESIERKVGALAEALEKQPAERRR
jgi:TRAP-type C4-dicarboxylate transport system permease large subunit